MDIVTFQHGSGEASSYSVTNIEFLG
jgi:hypothetical protein